MKALNVSSSVIENPINKDNFTECWIWIRTPKYNNGFGGEQGVWSFEADIKFIKDSTQASHNIEESTLEDLLIKLKQFTDAL